MPDATPEREGREPLDRDVWIVASTLDYPSAHMGGPGWHNIQTAKRILEALRRHGYRIERDEELDGVDANGR